MRTLIRFAMFILAAFLLAFLTEMADRYLCRYDERNDTVHDDCAEVVRELQTLVEYQHDTIEVLQRRVEELTREKEHP